MPDSRFHAISAWMSGQVAAWDVFLGAGTLSATSTQAEIQAAQVEVQTQVVNAHKNVAKIPAIETEVQTLEREVNELATAAHVKLK